MSFVIPVKLVKIKLMGAVYVPDFGSLSLDIVPSSPPPMAIWTPPLRIIQAPDESECTHPFLTDDGVCRDCRNMVMPVTGLGETKRGSRITDRSILPDMDAFEFSTDIKMEANRIFGILTIPKQKKKNRQLLVFLCIYAAHLQQNDLTDPVNIALRCGISEKNMMKCITKFQKQQIGYSLPITEYTPLHLLPTLCKALQLTSETMEDVMNLTSDLIEKIKRPPINKLYFEGPRKLAGGILYYYLDLHGVSVSKELICSIAGLSNAAIGPMRREISAIHNS